MGGQGCPDTDALGAFVAGTLDATALAAMQRHLAICDHCLTVAAHAAHGAAPASVEPGASLAPGASFAPGASGPDAVAAPAPAELAADAGEDRFVVGALIATGGMGAVYRGVERGTGRRVAIKRLHAHARRHHKGFERFLREVEILARLDHPNIIKHVAAVHRTDQIDLVMDYAPGGSLRDVLNAERALPVERTLRWLLELTDALARAHHLGVIHRDIKPENVLLGASGAPCLSDFGLARSGEGTLTSSGVLLGTLPYLSPELLDGGAGSEADDLWALGVMAFEMLAGERPFQGRSHAAVASAILHAPAPDLRRRRPELPALVATLVERMLDKDPGQRFTSARSLGAELERVLRAMRGSGVPAAASASLGPAAKAESLAPTVSHTDDGLRRVVSARVAVAETRSRHAGTPWPPRLTRGIIAATVLLALGVVSVAGWRWRAQIGWYPEPSRLQRGLISDFERGQVDSALGYGWRVTSDASRGGTSAASLSIVAGGASDSRWALAVSGEVHPMPRTPSAPPRSSGLYAGVSFVPGPAPQVPVDLSSTSGLAFSIKGDGRAYDVVFFTRGMISSPHVYRFVAEPAWQRHRVRYADYPGLDSHEVTSIWFGAVQPGPVSFQLDDIELF